MTSLAIHSRCRGLLALDENPSGWFWDTGVGAPAFNGGDHWSLDGPMGRRTWAGVAPALSLNFDVEMFSLVGSSA